MSYHHLKEHPANSVPWGSILKPAGMLTLGLFTHGTVFPVDPVKPNILLIMVDDHGYGDLSVNGATDVRTPNLDRLFRKGVQHTAFYSNCTVCSPTRASLLTGRFPDLSGVPGVIRTHETDSWGYLREDLPTLPDMLVEAGYRTALIGKWHLGLESPNTPNERGFGFFKGFLGDMMDDYWSHLRHGINYMRMNSQEIHPEGHATDLFSDWAIDYLQDAVNDAQPFFLFLSYNAPHFPIQPPENWLLKVKQREPRLPEQRAKNVAFVEHMDHAIGRVLDALEKTGMESNTLVIFTSDNGGSLPHGASNGVLRGGKQDMYEGGIKVPTCFVWKGRIDPGTTCCHPAMTMDIFPVLCEIAGVKPAHEIDGISFLPGITGKHQIGTERVLFWMRREGGHYGGLCYYAVRKGRYKLLQNTPFEPFQLFDIEADPNEQQPITEHSGVFNDLRFSLSQHIRKSGAIPWQKTVNSNK